MAGPCEISLELPILWRILKEPNCNTWNKHGDDAYVLG